MTSISKAKACGADAVKFQLYTDKALYGISDALPSIGYQTPVEWLPKMKEKADAVGIEFICSAFSPELIDAVDPYVNIHKVASAELTHKRMLERLRNIRKPVFLSTGASGLEDIRGAVGILEDTPTVIMYCVAAYPAREVNLGLIPVLANQFPDKMIGYSDHTLDARTVPVCAVAAGAVVLEKHVTFIEGVDALTPDSPHSLTMDEFKRMVAYVRGTGHDVIGPTTEELPMILRHNRRLIATRDVAKGDMLIEGRNFGCYRSLKDDTKGLHGFLIDEVHSRIAKNDIKAGDSIGPEDV